MARRRRTSCTRPTPSTSPAPTDCRCSSASTASGSRASRRSTSACAQPIEDGQADRVYAFGTDPELGKLGPKLIDDDKGTYSAGLSYQTFPVVSTKFYEGLTEAQRSAFTDTPDRVNAGLTQEAILPLISRVRFDQEDPEVVAAAFLKDAGIVTS